MWRKIRDLSSSITKHSDDYNERHMKTKLNLDGELPLTKTIEIRSRMIVVSAAFHENSKFYPHVFLD